MQLLQCLVIVMPHGREGMRMMMASEHLTSKLKDVTNQHIYQRKQLLSEARCKEQI